MKRPFRDRRDAGRFLAEKLSAYANRPDVIVLALPRGGVPVAYEVARALNAPLDVFPVRKLGVPGHDELATGAIAPGGLRDHRAHGIVLQSQAEIARGERSGEHLLHRRPERVDIDCRMQYEK